QDQVADSPDSFKEQLDLLQNILKDVNRKVDILNTKEDAFQEKLDHVHQHLGSLIRKGNKVILFVLKREVLQYFSEE
ncbi:unnamed protein product, partial [Rotaria magnacalcarata]